MTAAETNRAEDLLAGLTVEEKVGQLFMPVVAGANRWISIGFFRFQPSEVAKISLILVLAATLACGYLGMEQGLKPTEPAKGSAYKEEFSLHRHIFAAIEALRDSEAMQSMLGANFVELYCKVKDDEYKEFQEIITPWEREILMFNV